MQGTTLKGKRARLRPITEEVDLPILYKWRNNLDSLYLWSVRRYPVTFDEFTEEFRHDLETDKHVQMIIESNSTKEPVGAIYSYDVNFIDGYCFVTIYVDSPYVRKGYGAEALPLFVNYLFTYFNFYKIYMEVYGYNDISISGIQKAGFLEEGNFKEHRLYDGKRHNMLRFALYRNRLPYIRKFIGRLTKSTK